MADAGPRLSNFIEFALYLIVRLVEELVCAIPGHENALAVGRALGRIGFTIALDRRNVVIENLTIAFGSEMTEREIRTLARRNFEHLGMLVIEVLRLRRWNQEELAQRLIIGGKDNFNLVWSPGPRGIFAVVFHFGTFEVLAATNRFLGLDGYLVVTPLPNRFVSRRLMFGRGGENSGLRIIPHKGIVHRFIRALHEGNLAIALVDQRGDDTRPVWVDYFGRKVLANGIFARFALEGNAHVLPVLAFRLENGRYYCHFGEPIPIEPTGDTERDVQEISQQFHSIAEAWLRKYPEQGFWVHRKFKRKPKKRKKRGS